MPEPLFFSIITPTGGRLDYLQECVRATQMQVLAGVEAQFEHVVLAQGDDAETRRWAGSEACPPHVVFLEEKEKLPPGEARNRAIGKARGNWIVLIDDDDVMLQRTLAYFGRGIQAHPEAGWFISDFLRVDEELRYMPGEDYYGWPFGAPEEMLQAIFKSENFVQGNVCFRKDLFYRAGEYDRERRTAEDLELYCRFLLEGALPVQLPMVSHLHRMHTRNTSKDIGRDHHFSDLTAIYRKLEGRLKERGVELALPA